MTASRAPRLVLAGAQVFDGRGSDPAPADLAIEDGRIVEVGGGLDGDEAIDVSGRTLLPGLFDCHTHVIVSDIDQWRLLQMPFSYQFYEAARNLQATLAAGITTVRDAGGADMGIRRAVEDGLVQGPRMQISVRMISQTGGHGDDWFPSGAEVPLWVAHPGAPATIVDGPDEMRRMVRLLIRHGADVIKVATSGGVLSARDEPRHAHFRDDELAVLVAEADAVGIAVMAHAQGAPGIKAAVRAGIRSIEHGIYLDDEAIEMMLERGTYLVPTLVAPRGVIDAAAAGMAVPEAAVRKAHEVVEVHRDSFRRAVAAGVQVAMGTDSGVTPHGENLRELALMVEGGMSAAEALVATTSTAARLMGLDDELGTLEPGKRADIVVVNGDPFDVMSLRERIEAVYRDGVRVIG
ncbi:MAG TPA: amidohydrolase family protein [Candidatus Caenarcaniphilales bacterium]|nr:amidohydrolase family protein [Candidatus Caenarcaniphilales bacterium]